MGHVSPIYGSPPQPHGTCGPPNPIFSGGGWIFLTRDKLLTNLNPTQTIVFTSTDHYADEDCFDPFPCGGLSEEVGTTVYGWRGNSLPTVTGPFNPTYIDFLDVDFTFDITT